MFTGFYDSIIERVSRFLTAHQHN